MHHRHRILHRDNLFATAADIAVGAAQSRQDQRGIPVHEMTAVEFGRNLHCQSATAQRRLGDGGIGGGRREVAAHPDEYRGVPVAHRADRGHRVVPMRAGAGDAELVVQSSQELLRHLLPNAHRAVTLHVGMSAHGAHSRARLADHAAQQ